MKPLLFLCLALVGCEPPEAPIDIVSRSYELVGVDGPKHVYVDLKSADGATILHHVYVSKHFNDWREHLIIGRVFVLRHPVYKGRPMNPEQFVQLYADLHKPSTLWPVEVNPWKVEPTKK